MKKMISLALLVLLVLPLVQAMPNGMTKGNKINGDLNHDCDVDMFDFFTFADYYGASKGDGIYRGWADLNKDGNIDRYDFWIFAENYGKSCEHPKGNNIKGDVNHDCIINMDDLNKIGNHYGYFRGEKNYRGWADINKDGVVDMRDMFFLAQNCGKICEHLQMSDKPKEVGNKIIGDVNHDCIVDMKDLNKIGEHFGSFRGEKNYRGWADIDKNGVVDIGDISLTAINYLQVCKHHGRNKMIL